MCLTVDITTLRGYIKSIQLKPFFAVKAKKNLQFKPITHQMETQTSQECPFGCYRRIDGILSWETLSWQTASGAVLRRGVFQEFTFLTNNFSLTSLQVANLNKNRWQIELLQMAQTTPQYKLGTSKNAVKIQIYCAICAYCLVAILQRDMHIDQTTYEVLQIFGCLVDGFNLSPKPLWQN